VVSQETVDLLPLGGRCTRERQLNDLSPLFAALPVDRQEKGASAVFILPSVRSDAPPVAKTTPEKALLAQEQVVWAPSAYKDQVQQQGRNGHTGEVRPGLPSKTGHNRKARQPQERSSGRREQDLVESGSAR
jgi:hypothetical protein